MINPIPEFPTLRNPEFGNFCTDFAHSGDSGFLKLESGTSEIPDYFPLSGAVVQHCRLTKGNLMRVPHICTRCSRQTRMIVLAAHIHPLNAHSSCERQAGSGENPSVPSAQGSLRSARRIAPAPPYRYRRASMFKRIGFLLLQYCSLFRREQQRASKKVLRAQCGCLHFHSNKGD